LLESSRSPATSQALRFERRAGSYQRARTDALNMSVTFRTMSDARSGGSAWRRRGQLRAHTPDFGAFRCKMLLEHLLELKAG